MHRFGQVTHEIVRLLDKSLTPYPSIYLLHCAHNMHCSLALTSFPKVITDMLNKNLVTWHEEPQCFTKSDLLPYKRPLPFLRHQLAVNNTSAYIHKYSLYWRDQLLTPWTTHHSNFTPSHWRISSPSAIRLSLSFSTCGEKIGSSSLIIICSASISSQMDEDH